MICFLCQYSAVAEGSYAHILDVYMQSDICLDLTKYPDLSFNKQPDSTYFSICDQIKGLMFI